MHWTQNAPPLFAIVTGYFPESYPNPARGPKCRPMLVLGSIRHRATGEIACRVAYGTTQNITRGHPRDAIVANLGDMNAAGLQHPTRFVTAQGAAMAILPWNAQFFRPWTGHKSPVLGLLPASEQALLRDHLTWLSDLPNF